MGDDEGDGVPSGVTDEEGVANGEANTEAVGVASGDWEAKAATGDEAVAVVTVDGMLVAAAEVAGVETEGPVDGEALLVDVVGLLDGDAVVSASPGTCDAPAVSAGEALAGVAVVLGGTGMLLLVACTLALGAEDVVLAGGDGATVAVNVLDGGSVIEGPVVLLGVSWVGSPDGDGVPASAVTRGDTLAVGAAASGVGVWVIDVDPVSAGLGPGDPVADPTAVPPSDDDGDAVAVLVGDGTSSAGALVELVGDAEDVVVSDGLGFGVPDTVGVLLGVTDVLPVREGVTLMVGVTLGVMDRLDVTLGVTLRELVREGVVLREDVKLRVPDREGVRERDREVLGVIEGVRDRDPVMDRLKEVDPERLLLGDLAGVLLMVGDTDRVSETLGDRLRDRDLVAAGGGARDTGQGGQGTLGTRTGPLSDTMAINYVTLRCIVHLLAREGDAVGLRDLVGERDGEATAARPRVALLEKPHISTRRGVSE
jgi:hypothetical protein